MMSWRVTRFLQAFPEFQELYLYIHEKTFGTCDWRVDTRGKIYRLVIFCGVADKKFITEVVVPYIKEWCSSKGRDSNLSLNIERTFRNSTKPEVVIEIPLVSDEKEKYSGFVHTTMAY